ncbi:hypothetical protein CK203_009188 [Vitis vinifera]|uniref:Uncharacterized protein n=1 Tax=Vitis vinifera TaxID=29760 RepID=A0A438K343_VITVI|nr:hypothetical protein CK203_009188 [Vitis vinifera]
MNVDMSVIVCESYGSRLSYISLSFEMLAAVDSAGEAFGKQQDTEHAVDSSWKGEYLPRKYKSGNNGLITRINTHARSTNPAVKCSPSYLAIPVVDLTVRLEKAATYEQVKVALNLSYVPVGESRSQRHNHPRNYLTHRTIQAFAPPCENSETVRELEPLQALEIAPSDGIQAAHEELYLHISAETFEKVDVAVALIELLVTPVSGNPAAVIHPHQLQFLG